MCIACDLFLDLKLYRIPDAVRQRINDRFPNVEIIPVNIAPGDQSYPSDAEIYWGNRLNLNAVKMLQSLKWVHFGSVGLKRQCDDEILARNILVTNSRGTMIAPMVASAMAFVCGLSRGIHRSYQLRQGSGLTRHAFDEYFDQIQEIEGQNSLIVGFGDVGKRFGSVCDAMGMKISVVSRSNRNLPSYVAQSYGLEQLEEAVTEADYVVGLLPYTPETHEVFSARTFKSMKTSAYFINIGRGETVDEGALTRALVNDDIAGAGLDVFRNEPLSLTSPLWDLDNVILTPHVAGLSQKYWTRQEELFTDNLFAYLEGGQMQNIVDLSKGY